MNEVIWIGFMLGVLGATLLSFRFFGRIGLFALITAGIILCNIQVTKTVVLFGMTMTLGNVLYGSVFLATDLLSEFYGKKEAARGVLFGFIFLVFMTVVMQVALLIDPEPEFGKPVHEAMNTIFGFMPRIALGSLAAYLVSQLHDVWAFSFWKKKTNGRKLWLRNNASTMVSQLIDSVIFCFIAFWGAEGFPPQVFWSVLLTTYFIKLAVAAVDTPFIYLAARMKPAELEAVRETATAESD